MVITALSGVYNPEYGPESAGLRETIRFGLVPAASADLAHVIDEFQHYLEEEDHELYNAWGGVVITENQDQLRRLDVFIVWQEVILDGNEPVLDEEGNPQPIFNEDGTPRMRIALAHTFVHEDAQYFP
jgi:hypothetical protein